MFVPEPIIFFFDFCCSRKGCKHTMRQRPRAVLIQQMIANTCLGTIAAAFSNGISKEIPSTGRPFVPIHHGLPRLSKNSQTAFEQQLASSQNSIIAETNKIQNRRQSSPSLSKMQLQRLWFLTLRTCLKVFWISVCINVFCVYANMHLSFHVVRVLHSNCFFP